MDTFGINISFFTLKAEKKILTIASILTLLFLLLFCIDLRNQKQITRTA